METAAMLFFRETNLDSALVPNFGCLRVAGARHMLQAELMQTSLTVTRPDSCALLQLFKSGISLHQDMVLYKHTRKGTGTIVVLDHIWFTDLIHVKVYDHVPR